MQDIDMKDKFQKIAIPSSRIATFDMFDIAMTKHHVAAFLEIDVTKLRSEIKERRRNREHISLVACILKTISSVVLYYPQIAGYKTSKKRIAVFEKPKFTFLVEKRLAGERVPFPLVIEDVLNKDVLTISKEIANAKDTDIAEGENVIGKKAKLQDKLYPKLPRFIRLIIWKVMLSNFRFSYKTMGNISVSSVGMYGSTNGWFLHKSIHPFSVGLGSVVRKPVVIKDKIEIREIMNVTFLIDHDLIDGAPAFRLMSMFVDEIKKGSALINV
ncbi:MAG: 2-oxo acid dehydrogenase subunit E2 [Bacteroidales bacterium]